MVISFVSAQAEYLGLWIDDEDRALLVERRGLDTVVTATRSARDETFSQCLPAGYEPLPCMDLPAYREVGDVRAFMRVELGKPGLGPTYDLEHDGWDSLRPAVAHGLYRDLDEDFGVPWAFPLAIYRRATDAEIELFERRTVPPIGRKVPRVPPRLPSRPNAIALSPDGRYIATAHGFVEGSSSVWSNDWQRVVEHVTRVWSVASGSLLLTDRHASRVVEVAFDGPGRVVSRSVELNLEELHAMKTYAARTSTIDVAAEASTESTELEARALARSTPYGARGELRSDDGAVVATWMDDVLRLRSPVETVLRFERPPE